MSTIKFRVSLVGRAGVAQAPDGPEVQVPTVLPDGRDRPGKPPAKPKPPGKADGEAGQKRIFRGLDADGDGEVTVPEYLAARWEHDVLVQWAPKKRTRKRAGRAASRKTTPKAKD